MPLPTSAEFHTVLRIMNLTLYRVGCCCNSASYNTFAEISTRIRKIQLCLGRGESVGLWCLGRLCQCYTWQVQRYLSISCHYRYNNKSLLCSGPSPPLSSHVKDLLGLRLLLVDDDGVDGGARGHGHGGRRDGVVALDGRRVEDAVVPLNHAHPSGCRHLLRLFGLLTASLKKYFLREILLY